MYRDPGKNGAFSTTRPSAPNDTAALKRLWKRSFGDDDSFINMFFNDFYTPGMATVLDYAAEIVSAGYSFPGFELVSTQGDVLPLTYGYAIGTLPDRRSRGFGARVTIAMQEAAWEKNSGFCISPAEDGLRKWYGGIIGAKNHFIFRECNVSAGDLSGVAPSQIRPVTPTEYNELRNSFLRGTAHVRFPLEVMEYQSLLCRFTCGGMYATDGGCAIIEDSGRKVTELITADEDSFFPFLCATLRLHSADSAVVRSPFYGGGAERPSVMVSLPDGFMLPGGGAPYWGPVFD